MSQLLTLIHNGAVGVTVGGLLYAVCTMTAVLVALLAPSPGRRGDARKVLALLLRRAGDEQSKPPGPSAVHRASPPSVQWISDFNSHVQRTSEIRAQDFGN